MTIIDWRARAYRGGSRWISSGVIAAYVGLSLPAVEVVDPDVITITVLAQDRTIAIPAEDRVIAVPAQDRTIAVPEKP